MKAAAELTPEIDAAQCAWTLPDAIAGFDGSRRCLEQRDHDGPHVVGVAGRITVAFYAVDVEARKLHEVVHARVAPGEPWGYVELAAMYAVVEAMRE